LCRFRVIWGHFVAVLRSFGPFKAVFSCLGRSLAVLKQFMDRFEVVFGWFWAVLGHYRVILGCCFGATLESIGYLYGPFWAVSDHFGLFQGHFGAIWVALVAFQDIPGSL
jgi:hypothetical protein